jgi:tetratricopeptide (TPR) repeat protein
VWILNQLGWSLRWAGRHREALGHLEKAARLAIDPAYTYALISTVHRALGDDAAADSWARMAFAANPRDDRVALNVGFSLQRVGRFEEAIEANRHAPDDGWTVGNSAQIRFLQGRSDEALELCRKAQRLRPFAASPFLNAALILARRDRPDEAVEELAALLEHAPGDDLAHAYLRRLLAHPASDVPAAPLERCIRALERAHSSEPPSVAVLGSLARAYRHLPGDENAARAIDMGVCALEAAETAGAREAEIASVLLALVLDGATPGTCALTALRRPPTYRGTQALFEANGAAFSSSCGDDTLALAAGSGDPLLARRARFLHARLLEARGQHGEAESLLRALATEETLHPEPLRIRCGGGPLTLPDGEVWGGDRFFQGGSRWNAGEVEIQGTDRDDLYRGARSFLALEPGGIAAYTIPVPRGRYRLRLHFAETEWSYPGQRRIDIIAGDRKVLEGFEILAEAPFRAAVVRELEAEVADRGLTIRLVHGFQACGALISAIEVELAGE